MPREEYERLAARLKLSRSELFRQMIEAYKVRLDEEDFFRLQRRMSRRAGKRGRFTEAMVARIVFAVRPSRLSGRRGGRAR
jgi:Ribbon-helix-helix protein, copG family